MAKAAGNSYSLDLQIPRPPSTLPYPALAPWCDAIPRLVADYREAAEKLRTGDRSVISSAGSFPQALPSSAADDRRLLTSARIPLIDLPFCLAGEGEVCLVGELSRSRDG
jgi:hypothetical protein